MNVAQQKSAPLTPAPKVSRKIGIPGKSRRTAANVVACALFSCTVLAHAALIEIPPVHSGSDSTAASIVNLGFLYDGLEKRSLADLSERGIQSVADDGRDGFLSAYPGVMQISETSTPHFRASDHIGTKGADVYSAIDAPYGVAPDAPSTASNDTDPELWSVLLLAAGLVGYQLRRKSRVGAIKVRPLHF